MHLRWGLLPTLIIATVRTCSAPAPTEVTTAQALRASVGVNLHLEYASTPYRDPAAVLAALRFLGVAYARDAALRTGPESLASFAAIGRGGVMMDLFVNNDIDEQLARLSTLERLVPGSLDYVEGPNEANNEGYGGGGAGDPKRLEAYQARLYAKVHTTPDLSRVPVISFTYWPPLFGRADIANFHAYPNLEGTIAFDLLGQQRLAKAVQPAEEAIVCTETGFATAGPNRITEARQAALEPILLLENFRSGVRKTYLYELFDEVPEPAARTDPGGSWGLFHYNGEPKPAALALRRFMALLSVPGFNVRGRPMPWVRLSGSKLRTLRVERADGARLTFSWWADANADPHRLLTALNGEGVEVIDLASPTSQRLSGPKSKILAGAAPLVFVQNPQKIKTALAQRRAGSARRLPK